MKTLYLIGGTMGAGKTTTCQLLKKELEKAVFLDGDWCWDADPFVVTEETMAMVLDNICFLLNSFLRCSAYENIIFCWVMHQQSMIDELLSRLHVDNCRVVPVSLICGEAALRERLEKDVHQGIRQRDVIQRSVERIPLYASLHTEKVDVSRRPPQEAVKAILEL